MFLSGTHNDNSQTSVWPVWAPYITEPIGEKGVCLLSRVIAPNDQRESGLLLSRGGGRAMLRARGLWGHLSVVPCPVVSYVKATARRMTEDSDHSGENVQITPPSKEPRAAESLRTREILRQAVEYNYNLATSVDSEDCSSFACFLIAMCMFVCSSHLLSSHFYFINKLLEVDLNFTF